MELFLVTFKKNVFLNQLFLGKKLNKTQGCAGYLATDCKASLARIGAVSLPQSA
jgi:hypothetical protein